MLSFTFLLFDYINIIAYKKLYVNYLGAENEWAGEGEKNADGFGMFSSSSAGDGRKPSCRKRKKRESPKSCDLLHNGNRIECPDGFSPPWEERRRKAEKRREGAEAGESSGKTSLCPPAEKKMKDTRKTRTRKQVAAVLGAVMAGGLIVSGAGNAMAAKAPSAADRKDINHPERTERGNGDRLQDR